MDARATTRANRTGPDMPHWSRIRTNGSVLGDPLPTDPKRHGLREGAAIRRKRTPGEAEASRPGLSTPQANDFALRLSESPAGSTNPAIRSAILEGIAFPLDADDQQKGSLSGPKTRS